MPLVLLLEGHAGEKAMSYLQLISTPIRNPPSPKRMQGKEVRKQTYQVNRSDL